MSAGELRDPVRVEAQAPAAAGDKYGRGSTGWATFLGLDPVWAKARPRNAGGEAALETRLESRQAWEVLMRADPDTVRITAGHRVIVLADDLYPFDRVLDIKTVGPWSANPAYILATCEETARGA